MRRDVVGVGIIGGATACRIIVVVFNFFRSNNASRRRLLEARLRSGLLYFSGVGGATARGEVVGFGIVGTTMAFAFVESGVCFDAGPGRIITPSAQIRADQAPLEALVADRFCWGRHSWICQN